MEARSACVPKLLLVGGKPTGSIELARSVKSLGGYLIVSDYLPKEQSPAKQIADECWDCSTADVDELLSLCQEAGVTGLIAGVHEFNIERMAELAQRGGFNCYCTPDLLQKCVDKREFKQWCADFGIDIAREYQLDEALALDSSDLPLAIKPLDGNGSCGFTKCTSLEELPEAVERAVAESSTGQALIEEFVDSDAVIIHYTASDGEIVFSGIADKASKSLEPEAPPIMAVQCAPSIHQAKYLEEVDGKAKSMLAAMGFEEGPIWIEAFYKDGRFIFNEIGYRFGASLTYKMVKSLCGIDQLDLMIKQAMGIDHDIRLHPSSDDAVCAIWPVHLLPGKIVGIHGVDELEKIEGFESISLVHCVGDEIEDWGTARQVLGYVHLKAKSVDALVCAMAEVMDTLDAEGEDGSSLLTVLLDPKCPAEFPRFLSQQMEDEDTTGSM